MIPKRIQMLQVELNTQDNCATQTPLFCVHVRNESTDPEDGTGELRAIFLTGEGAEWYIKKLKHRLANPYIWVRGPGEHSDLHTLIEWFKTLDLNAITRSGNA